MIRDPFGTGMVHFSSLALPKVSVVSSALNFEITTTCLEEIRILISQSERRDYQSYWRQHPQSLVENTTAKTIKLVIDVPMDQSC